MCTRVKVSNTLHIAVGAVEIPILVIEREWRSMHFAYCLMLFLLRLSTSVKVSFCITAIAFSIWIRHMA
jgi:hypothetical protein